MFGELRLWTDSDADGVSRPEELRDLPDAGIREVDLTGAATCGTVTDRHGNDLSLRGSFTALTDAAAWWWTCSSA